MKSKKTRVNPHYMEKLYSFYCPFYEWVFGKLLGPGRRKAFKYLSRRPDQKVLEIGVGPGIHPGILSPPDRFCGHRHLQPHD